MPRCRKCKKDWPDDATFCPDDGHSFTSAMDPLDAIDALDSTVAFGAGAPATGPSTTTSSPKTTESLSSGTGQAAAAVAERAIRPPPPNPEDASDLVAGMVVGEYRIEKKIGEGGMGAVYSAVHPMIGKKAAIKVISAALGADPSAVQRFVDEARSVNQIGHPNIVDVFAFGTLPDGRNYFAMEYLLGEGLSDRISSATMSLGEAIEILDQVADALEAAHEKKIVHRDLKPDNVYLAAVRGGRTMVKLLDFGIAKLAVAEGGIAKTRTGMMMGTPGYISPEQARGKNVDHRTDVYALGCMMFEIACGRLPFVADNAMDIVLMHMTTAPPKPSDLWPQIPPPLEQLITGMLDKNPENRPSLTQVRGVFSDLVNSGLVTIDNKRGPGFRSGVGRTPATGTPIPRPNPSGIALGTSVGVSPGTQPGTATPAMGTTPPIAGQVEALATPKKKTGLIVGVLAGVVLLAGGGIFLATRGGGHPPVIAAKPIDPPPVALKPPPPEVPKQVPVVETPKTVVPDAPPAAVGGTIELTLADKAKIEVDGKVVAWTGKVMTIPVATDGPHTVAITARGKLPFAQTVEVAAGNKVALEAKLEKPKSGTKLVPPGTGSAKPPGTGSAGKKGPDDAVCDPFAPGSKC